MAVSVRFLSGKTREFPAATTAFRRGGLLIVVDGAEERKMDAADIVEAIVRDADGATVETIPGKARAD